ncbi:MAG: UbiA family prenyltransferase [Chloroflexota bacterium]|nr:UbiA family prenyltransferase [Chloroflexota bacterium]
MTAGLALVAGAVGSRALLLGLAMASLQVSIGALNDVLDVDRDRGRKPGKPIPAGLVGQGTAIALVAASLLVGLAASAVAGPAVLAVALLGTGVGWAYDLWLKPTSWGWLPFAVGLPLLPVFAWVGATGRVPPAFGLLVPMAIVAGAGVSLLNGLADIDRDRAAGLATPAVRLGAHRARWLSAALLGLGAAGALGTLAAIGAQPLAWAVAVAGLALVVAGTVLAGSPSGVRRERGWEAGAIGLGLVGAGWLLGFAGRGLL